MQIMIWMNHLLSYHQMAPLFRMACLYLAGAAVCSVLLELVYYSYKQSMDPVIVGGCFLAALSAGCVHGVARVRFRDARASYLSVLGIITALWSVLYSVIALADVLHWASPSGGILVLRLSMLLAVPMVVLYVVLVGLLGVYYFARRHGLARGSQGA